MKYILIILFLSGCGVENWHEYTPEEQGDYAKRCEANNLDWGIADRGRIFCKKKETK